MSNALVQANTRTGQASTWTPRRLLLWAGIVAFGIAAWANFVAEALIPALARPHWPESYYWVSARLALEGRGDLIYADPAVFTREAIRLGANPDIFGPQFPTVVLPFLPVALLSDRRAYLLWLVFILACFCLAWGILLAALRLAPAVRLALWAMVPLFQPLRDNFKYGQVYPLLLLLLVVGAVLAIPVTSGDQPPRRAGIGAGLAFGLLCIYKSYYAAILLIPILIRRQWTVLRSAVAVFGLAALITLVWWGIQPWLTAISWTLQWHEQPEVTVVAYQTINGWLAHMLRYEPTLNPRPVADLPALVTPLWTVAAVVILGLSLVAWWRAAQARQATRTRRLLALALGVPVAQLLITIATEYHFALLLFPLLIAGAALGEAGAEAVSGADGNRRPPAWLLGAWGVLLIAAVLLGGNFWTFNRLDIGRWQALMSYPRLYGTFLVWVLILVLLWRAPGSTRAERWTMADGR